MWKYQIPVSWVAGKRQKSTHKVSCMSVESMITLFFRGMRKIKSKELFTVLFGIYKAFGCPLFLKEGNTGNYKKNQIKDSIFFF